MKYINFPGEQLVLVYVPGLVLDELIDMVVTRLTDIRFTHVQFIPDGENTLQVRAVGQDETYSFLVPLYVPGYIYLDFDNFTESHYTTIKSALAFMQAMDEHDEFIIGTQDEIDGEVTGAEEEEDQLAVAILNNIAEQPYSDTTKEFLAAVTEGYGPEATFMLMTSTEAFMTPLLDIWKNREESEKEE